MERYVEAALVLDGFDPFSIILNFGQIRQFLHSTQGNLIADERAYCAYVSQIRELGTRQSAPYRRVITSLFAPFVC